MSKSRSRKRNAYFLFTAIGFLGGFIYTMLDEGFSNQFALFNTWFIGILVGLFTAIFELSIYPSFIRKLSFPVKFILRSVFYITSIISIILMELIIARMIKYKLSFQGVLNSEEFLHYLKYEDFGIGILYAILLVMAFNFTRQINRNLGQGTLINLVTGKYVRPQEQYKVIMFLRIADSTKLLKDLGRIQFNDFLNNFIYDITEPIISYSGELYEYFEDQVVIAWNFNTGINNANCIRAFFEARDELRFKKEKYVNKYGFAPELTAAIGAGPIIKGEIGIVKSTIKYSGDLMNITSRMLDWCMYNKKGLILSESLFKSISLPVIFEHHEAEHFVPKGKKDVINVYKVGEKKHALL